MAATISNNAITSTIGLDDGVVTLTAADGGYTLKNSAGQYLGPNSSGLSSGVVNAAIREEAIIHEVVDINEEGIVTISATYGESTTVYLRFNQANNQLKARYYTDATKVKGFTLFKKNASPVNSLKQDVDTFVETYLHMTDYTENLGYCKDAEHHYYADAKAAFGSLSADAKQYFLSNYDDAKARLSAWADANNETFDPVNGTFEAIRPYNVFDTSESNNVIYIVLASCVVLIAVGSIIVLVKRKQK